MGPPGAWRDVLRVALEQPSWAKLEAFLRHERATQTVFPPEDQVFAAFALTAFADVRVLLLGQDPYHDDGQAHGLAFSVHSGKAPPSLRNIFKELEADLGIKRTQTDLSGWARQGVLLLNTVLTVRAHQAASHKAQGWEAFTDAVVAALNARAAPVVFVLWGAHAQKKLEQIDAVRHTVIVAAHPSPLSAHNGFFGSEPFSKVNAALEALGQGAIDWSR